MKSWLYSLEVGVLKLVTLQPCGFTPPKTCSIKLSFRQHPSLVSLPKVIDCHLRKAFLEVRRVFSFCLSIFDLFFGQFAFIIGVKILRLNFWFSLQESYQVKLVSIFEKFCSTKDKKKKKKKKKNKKTDGLQSVFV